MGFPVLVIRHLYIESVHRIPYFVVWFTPLDPKTLVKVRAWMHNYIPWFYVHVITYPCLQLIDGSDNLYWWIEISSIQSHHAFSAYLFFLAYCTISVFAYPRIIAVLTPPTILVAVHAIPLVVDPLAMTSWPAGEPSGLPHTHPDKHPVT